MFLLAGISKTTAKLEESLKMSSNDNKVFLKSSENSCSQLFPSASGNQKPNSNFKHKAVSTEDKNSTIIFSKSNALKKTLQLLQSKSAPMDSSGMTSKSPTGKNVPSQLPSNMDSEDDKYHYSDDHPKNAQSKEMESRPPFWSMNALSAEPASKDSDKFDIKEHLYEQWRQSIHQSDENQKAPRKDKLANVDPFFTKKISDKIEPSSLPSLVNSINKDGEGLDTTVENIVKSIGFNFDLSKRVQELVQQKKQEQGDFQSGIVDESVSLLDKHIFDEDVKTSLLRSGKKEASLETVNKEARDSRQKSKSFKTGYSSQDNSKRENQQYQDRSRRSSSCDKERAEWDVFVKYDQWEHLSTKKADVRSSSGYRDNERNVIATNSKEASSRSYFSEQDLISPSRERYFVGCTDEEKYLEKFKDELNEEYFYPDEDDLNKSLVIPLLTSFSSRKKEDFRGGLLTEISTVEHVRVMSCSTESTDEPFMESMQKTPVKQNKRVNSSSCTSHAVERKSDILTIAPLSKESKVCNYDQENTDGYLDSNLNNKMGSLNPRYSPKSKSTNYRAFSPICFFPEYKSGSYCRSPDRGDNCCGRDKSPDQKRSPGQDRSPKDTPRFNRKPLHQIRKYEKFSDVGKSPSEYCNEGERYFNKRSQRSSSSNYSRLSGRTRSRSPCKYTNRSSKRHRSRSTEKYKHSSERYRPPLRSANNLLLLTSHAEPTALVVSDQHKNGNMQTDLNSRQSAKVNSKKRGRRKQLCYHCRRMGHLVENCPMKIKDIDEPDNSYVRLECYSCRKVGHLARNCPTKSEDMQESDNSYVRLQCYNCRKVGHLARNCPTKSEETLESDNSFVRLECYNCREVGHLARNCPTKSDDIDESYYNSFVRLECYNCRKMGHLARNCPTKSEDMHESVNAFVRLELECYNCREVGHIARYCPTKSENIDESDNSFVRLECYNCREVGHLARNCPMKSEDMNESDNSFARVECYNCTEVGHLARNCPMKSMDIDEWDRVECYNCGEVEHYARNCPMLNSKEMHESDHFDYLLEIEKLRDALAYFQRSDSDIDVN